MVNHKADERRSFDTPGFILSGVGLASLLFGLDQLGRPPIAPWLTATLIGAGARRVRARGACTSAAPRTR